MIIFELVKHKWKETLRSSIWEKSLALKIIYFFLSIYFLANFLLIGVFLDRLLMEIFPDENPVIKLNEFLFYFLIFDLFIRFLAQSLPTLSIQPYLHLPVKKRTIMHYLSVKTLLHPLNYLYFVIFIPFSLRAIAQIYSLSAAIVWLFALLFLFWFNSSLIAYVKRQFSSKPSIALILLGLLAILFGLDYYNLVPFSFYSGKIFTLVITNKLLLIVPFIISSVMYLINYSFLKKNAYIEVIAKNIPSKVGDTKEFNFINYFAFEETGIAWIFN